MINATDLMKRYDDGLLALDSLNLRVDPGEIYCLIGSNGAGKTTTINLFLNFIKPSSGYAYINGIDVTKHPLEAKKYLSYISETVMLYGNYSARQNLQFFARLGGAQGLKKDDYYTRLREVGLPERSFEQDVKEFSKGMRQKVGIAIAMLRDTPAILLDEPVSGLDPKAVMEFTEILVRLRGRGKAILMSTHDIFHVKEIATRVGILREGRKVLERTREEIENEDLQSLYLDYMQSSYRDDSVINYSR